MNRPPATFQYSLRFGVAQTIGLTALAIYSSFTFAYSYIAVPPLVSHASEKLLAKQWLQAYQYAPRFVPPLILSGTAANAYLAYHTPFSSSRLLYGSAAVLIFSIIPWTFIFFEPGVNGAAKWKVQQLLHDEGYDMPTQTGLMPSPKEHTGTLEARRWADSVTMKDIVERWARLNANRYIVTAVATTISALATCHWIYGPLPGISS